MASDDEATGADDPGGPPGPGPGAACAVELAVVATSSSAGCRQDVARSTSSYVFANSELERILF